MTDGNPGQQPPADGVPPYGGQPHGAQPYGQEPGYGVAAYGVPGSDPHARPGTVTAACVLTWVFSGLALLLGGFLLLSAATARDQVVDQFEQDERYEDLEVSGETVVDVIAAISASAVVLSVLAIVLAVLAFRRSKAGRAGLIALAVVTALVCLPLSLAVVGVPWLIVAVVAVVLLAGRNAGDWYQRRDRVHPYGGVQDPAGGTTWPPPPQA